MKIFYLGALAFFLLLFMACVGSPLCAQSENMKEVKKDQIILTNKGILVESKQGLFISSELYYIGNGKYLVSHSEENNIYNDANYSLDEQELIEYVNR